MDTQRLRSRPLERVLTFDMFDKFLSCRYRFWRQYVQKDSGVVCEEAQVAQLAGQACERVTAARVEQQEQLMEDVLRTLPDGPIGAAVATRVRAMVKQSQCYFQSHEEGRPELLAQVQYSWLDPKTGWTLKAKPDFVELLREDTGYGPQRDQPGILVRIIDEKSTKHVTERQIRNLQFFALVARMQLEEERLQAQQRGEPTEYLRFQIVIRPLAGEAELVRDWDCFRESGDLLYRIRKAVPAMEQSMLEGDFPPSASRWNCDRCPFKSTCPAHVTAAPPVAPLDAEYVA